MQSVYRGQIQNVTEVQVVNQILLAFQLRVLGNMQLSYNCMQSLFKATHKKKIKKKKP